MAVVHLLAGRDVAGAGIARVVKGGIVRQPGNAGCACAFNLLREQLAGSSFNYTQSADFRSVGRGAVSHVLAVMGREPPIQSDGSVGCKRVYVHQGQVFSLQPLTDIDDRLVLMPFAPLIKVITTSGFWRFNTANGDEPLQAGAQLIAAWYCVEDVACIVFSSSTKRRVSGELLFSSQR